MRRRKLERILGETNFRRNKYLWSHVASLLTTQIEYAILIYNTSRVATSPDFQKCKLKSPDIASLLQ